MTIKNVAVIGAGLMGRQIGLNTAIYPYEVYVYEANPEARAKVKAWEDDYLAGRIKKGRMTEEQVAGIKARFHLTETMEEAVKDADLIIEAVPERSDLKHAVLRGISDIAREDAIIATNSSIMVSSEFKDDVKNPARLLNIHYFNPALVMLLVEIVKGEHTDPKIAEIAYQFVKTTGKTPIMVNKEIEGFLANRILGAIKQEARWLVENGYCTFYDADTACENGLGHPKGPFKLNDFTGLDLQLDQMNRQWEKTGKKPCCYDLYKKLVDEGNLGVKSGKGFYDYTGEKADDNKKDNNITQEEKFMEIKKLAVIGAGLMGRQIGLNTAIYPYEVYIYDAFPEARTKLKAWEDDYLAGRVAKGRMTEEQVAGIKSRFHITETMEEAVKDADMIIEAVNERENLKREILSAVSKVAREDAIIATNSSVMPSSLFAADVKNPARLLNVHYFNPALVMKLVEIVVGPHTDLKYADIATEFCRATGKTPVRVNKEIDGFLANRILGAINREARWLVDQGYCSYQDLDTACENGLGHKMGPFRTNDLTGLDLSFDLMNRTYEKTGEKPLCYDLYKKMVEEGRLGQKSGRGFYDYTK